MTYLILSHIFFVHRWLYKNAVVTETKPDAEDAQFQHVSVVATDSQLRQFYSAFVESA